MHEVKDFSRQTHVETWLETNSAQFGTLRFLTGRRRATLRGRARALVAGLHVQQPLAALLVGRGVGGGVRLPAAHPRDARSLPLRRYPLMNNTNNLFFCLVNSVIHFGIYNIHTKTF